ncbi:MAG TPA: group III truncated hemoglobin [Rhodocyclaceae bacterium]|jgi:hemoglobin|nr:group III truncated hemoglobin [Rhodocyclaceae bacterium]
MRDIANDIGRERIAQTVTAFYAQVRQHPTLSIPFARVDDWPHHLEVLIQFWWVSLGGERYLGYDYQVPAKHAAAGFTPELLVDWLALFKQTLESHLPADLAAAWYARAERIGNSLRMLHEDGHMPGLQIEQASDKP